MSARAEYGFTMREMSEAIGIPVRAIEYALNQDQFSLENVYRILSSAEPAARALAPLARKSLAVHTEDQRLIGEAMKKLTLMSEEGVSPNRISEITGISPTHIAVMLTGQRPMSRRVAEKVLASRDMEISDITKQERYARVVEEYPHFISYMPHDAACRQLAKAYHLGFSSVQRRIREEGLHHDRQPQVS